MDSSDSETAERSPLDVTVVVPAHEISAGLAALLESLDSQVPSEGIDKLRVVISDDGSSPPIADSLDRSFAGLDIEHVRSPVNQGPGAARNRGLARVSTRWVSFLDSDTVPQPGWLARLVDRTSQPDAPDGIEGPVEVPGTDVNPFTHATRIQAPDGMYGGANITYQADVIRAVGGFSEAFYDPLRKLHFREDTELRFRMAEHGKRVDYEPTLVVEHPPLPGSFWSPIRLARRYYFDPLLSSQYPDQFRAMNRKRSVNGYSMRRARHDAALASVAGGSIAIVGVGARSPSVVRAGLVTWAVGLLGSTAALTWRRKVSAAQLPSVMVVAAIVPWVYVYHYYRGVARFRHFARM